MCLLQVLGNLYLQMGSDRQIQGYLSVSAQCRKPGRAETETKARAKTLAYRSNTNPATHLPHHLSPSHSTTTCTPCSKASLCGWSETDSREDMTGLHLPERPGCAQLTMLLPCHSDPSSQAPESHHNALKRTFHSFPCQEDSVDYKEESHLSDKDSAAVGS